MTSNRHPCVRLFHVKHPWAIFTFPRTGATKISPSTSSTPIRPTMRSIAAAARRRSSAIKLGLRCFRREAEAKRLARVLKSSPMPFKRQQRRLRRRHALFGQIAQWRQEACRSPRRSWRIWRNPSSRRVERFPGRSILVRTTRACPPANGGGGPLSSSSQRVRSACAARRSARRTPSRSTGSSAIANSGGVDENYRIAAEIEKHLDQVARRSGVWGGNCDVAAGERIDQGRFSDIGRTGDDNDEPFPQASSRFRARERAVDTVHRRAPQPA